MLLAVYNDAVTHEVWHQLDLVLLRQDLQDLKHTQFERKFHVLVCQR